MLAIKNTKIRMKMEKELGWLQVIVVYVKMNKSKIIENLGDTK